MAPIKLKVKGKRQKMLFFCDKRQNAWVEAGFFRRQISARAAVELEFR